MAGNKVTLVFAGDADRLDKTFRQVDIGAAKVTKGVTSVSNAFNAFNVAVVAAGQVAIDFGRDSVTAFAEAEAAQGKLSDAFARFPALADSNLERLQALNEELAKKVRFDDDAFASGQAVLAQFKLSGKQIETITPLLADYAAKTGKDLPAAADTLGRAFLGQTRGLKELGINYKSTGDQAKDITNITALVRAQVGGFAEKEGATASGQAAILSNRFGEIKETVGEKLLPVLMTLSEWGIKTIDWISQNSEIIGPLVAVIGTVVAAQWAWNIALAANPIGLIVIGIAALVAGIVWVATKTQFFQTVWRVAWGGIKSAASTVVEWIQNIPEGIGRTFSNIARFISAPFRAAFNFVADAWNNTIGKLSWTTPEWLPFGLGGKTISAPQLPKFHSGGVVPGAPGTEMLAVLQAGERVTPASGAASTMLELHSSGNRVDDLLMEIFARAVKARGGNVQVAVMGR